MKFFKRAGAALLGLAFLSAAMSLTAMADSKEKVGKIYLTIDSNIRSGSSGGSVEITPTSNNTDAYYIDSWEILNEDDDSWERNDPPEVEVVLGVADDEEYYFSSSSSSGFKLTLGSSLKDYFDEIKFVGAKREDDNATLILTFRLVFDEDADISSSSAPSGLAWNDTHNGVGYWDDVSSAKYYQTQLMKDGSAVGSILDIHQNSYDFSSQITQPGSYQFKLRSVKSSNSSKSGWTTSRSWSVTAEDIARLGGSSSVASGADGSWQQMADGGRWWWRNVDGTFPAASWKNINGQWYYFDEAGYMMTGWVTIGGISYYLDGNSGAMLSNQQTPDGYWVNESGAWVQ